MALRCWSSFLLLLPILVGTGCGGGSGAPAPAPPVITSFTASHTAVTAGTGAALTAVFSHGTGTVDQGLGPVGSGLAIPVKPCACTTYTLTVTNAAGLTATRSVGVRVVPAPAADIRSGIPDGISVTAGAQGLQASVPAQAGCTYAWTLAGGAITGGGTGPGVTFTAGPEGTLSLAVTVTNEAGASATGTWSRPIVAAPADVAVTAPPAAALGTGGLTASVTPVSGAQYQWSIVGGVLTSSETAATVTFAIAGAVGETLRGTDPGLQAGAAGACGQAALSLALAFPTGERVLLTSVVGVLCAPEATVTAPAGAFAGSAGLTASVPDQAGASYAWSITGGTITAGAATRGVVFTAGAPGVLTLACQVTNNGQSTAGTAEVTVLPLPPDPAITAFTAGPATVSAGGVATLGASFSGGTGVITPGNLPVLPGGSVAVSPAGTTTYTLTATNAAGATASRSCTVTVVPLPAVAGFAAAESPILAGSATTLLAAFSDGTGTVDQGIGPVASGAGIPTGPLASSRTYTLTVTNAAGSSVTRSATVEVGAAVGISAFGAVPATITAGQSAALGPVFQNASAATVSGGVGPVVSGRTYQVTPDSTTTYTLTAQGLGGPVSRTVSVSVVPAPTTPTITAPALVTAGATGLSASVPRQGECTYAWTLAGGTLTAGQGSERIQFTAGVPGTLSLSCTVTNLAGTAAAPGTASCTSVAAPTTPVVTAPASVTAGQAGYTASVQAQAGCTYAWRISGGTILGGVTSASVGFTPGASGTVQAACTITNAAGTAATPGTAACAIVAAPARPTVAVPACVTALQVGSAALVSPQAGCTFAWTISGGTLQGSATGTSISFTAGSAGMVQISCTATNAAGTVSTPGAVSSTIVAAPATPVVTAPTRVTAYQGGCAASTPAQPGCTYGWGISGGTIQGSASGTTIQFTAGLPGTLRLTCTVRNAAGTASVPGTLPVMVTDLPPAIGYSSGSYGFTAHAPIPPLHPTSSGGAVVTWAVSPPLPLGLLLDPATGVISGTPSAATPAGGYTITATNGGGSASVTPIITVNPPPPSIPDLFQPASLFVVLGRTATFRVEALGAPPLTYQWRRNGIPIPGATANAYTTPPAVRTSSGAKFTVTVTDAWGGSTLSAEATLTVAKGVFTPTGPLGEDRAAHSATLLADGRVLIAGGASNGAAGVLAGAEVFDPATGTFTATGSMALGRVLATATLLPGGKVLIAGGFPSTPSTPPLASAEVYDPATGTFTAAGSMGTARAGHTATLLADGKVLLAGGFTGSTVLGSAEVYDPATGAFSAVGSMGTARAGQTATLLASGKVLTAGGTTPSGYAVLAELYDPLLRMFVPTGALASGRRDHTATLLPGGKVLLAGGMGSGGALPSAEVYDPATGRFTTTGPLGWARFAHAAAPLPGGKVLLTGGIGGPGGIDGTWSEGTAEVFDPSTNLFTAVGFLGKARRRHTATPMANGMVLLVGGEAPGPSAGAEVYDPQTFLPTGPLVSPRSNHAAALMADGQVLLAGGSHATGQLGSTEVYDPATGAFTARGSLATARCLATATPLPGGGVLVAGGFGGGAALQSAEVYTAASGQWTATGNLLVGRMQHTATPLADGRVLLAGGRNGTGAAGGAEGYSPAAGAFTQVLPGPSPRWGHTATLLLDGRVFIAGGYGSGFAELLNPTTGLSTPTGPGAPRYGHTATLLANGKVLLAGGMNSLQPPAAPALLGAEVFDPATGLFSPTGPLVTARMNHAAVALPDGRVLLVGGDLGSTMLGSLASAEIYDPATGRSTAVGSMGAARTAPTATLLPGGSVLIVGGGLPGTIPTTAEIYDP